MVSAEQRAGVEPPSPCVSICRLDRSGYCEGCQRTAVEIELWPEMEADRRWRLLDELERRRSQVAQQGETA